MRIAFVRRAVKSPVVKSCPPGTGTSIGQIAQPYVGEPVVAGIRQTALGQCLPGGIHGGRLICTAGDVEPLEQAVSKEIRLLPTHRLRIRRVQAAIKSPSRASPVNWTSYRRGAGCKPRRGPPKRYLPHIEARRSNSLPQSSEVSTHSGLRSRCRGHSLGGYWGRRKSPIWKYCAIGSP